jgi:bacterioferritin-associated ferredoxin
MIVCHCTTTNDRVITRCIDDGATDVDDVARHCGAGSVCGGCTPEIARLLVQRAAGHQPAGRLRPSLVG